MDANMSISVRGITKSFAGKGNKRERKLVLRDISFEVNEGEFVSLVGPSGCGKTTTLTIIAGFQTADSGQVLVNGEPCLQRGRKLRPGDTVTYRSRTCTTAYAT